MPSASSIPTLSRVPGVNVFPCSLAQERLWFLSELDTRVSNYNEGLALEIAGPLDVALVRSCLQALVARHETLRTTLAMQAGVLAQRIHETSAVAVPLVDLTAVDADVRARLGGAVRLQLQLARFDLEAGPLIRVDALRYAADRHVLSLSTHHVAADAWSLRVLLTEFAELYRAHVHGRAAKLPRLGAQYADVAVWQRRQHETGGFDASLDYWYDDLAGAPLLQLPTDFRRRDDSRNRTATVSRAIPESVAADLRRLGAAANGTLYMTLMAAWTLLLARYCGQSDVVIGTPAAMRGRGELDRVVGFLVNMVAVRSRLSSEFTFRQWLDRTRARAIEAMAHQDAPFEKVVERLRPARARSRNPLFDCAFAFLRRTASLQLPNLTLSFTGGWGEGATAKFDLALTIVEGAGPLTVTWSFNGALFRPSTIDALADAWVCLLEGIAADPNRGVFDYPLLSGDRDGRPRGAVVRESPVRCGLQQRFEGAVARTPDAVALVDGEHHVTYAELNRWANGIAAALRRAGVDLEVPVALLLERGAAPVAAILGVLKAGGVYLPLEPELPSERLRYVLDDAQPRVVLTQQSALDRLPAGELTILFVDDLRAHGTDVNPAWTGGPDNACYVIYTSGSTGRPKGTIVTHRNVVRLLDATDASFRFGGDDVWTLFHSYAFDFSVWEIWGALAFGGRLITVPYYVSRSAQEFHGLVWREQVTVLNQTPSAFQQVSRADEQGQPRRLALRYVIFGGEQLDPLTLESWFARHGDEAPALVNMYGITETTVHVTWRRISAHDVADGATSPIGRPIDDLSVFVFDDAQRPVPRGAVGEMFVGGAGVARGYLRRPGLTASRFVPDPFGIGDRLYRSGDRARWSDVDDLEYLGRADDQVKIRGHRIELREVAVVMTQCPGVAQGVAVAREVNGSQVLVGYWIASPGEPAVDDAALRAYLRSRLPGYMVPAFLVGLEALPLTVNGKVDRQLLPAPTTTTAGAPQGPRTSVEEIVAGIWAKVLQCDTPGDDDNFFDLGGHSLLATQVMSGIRVALGVDVPLRLLFEYPTVSGLATQIGALCGDAEPAMTPRPDRNSPAPLSFAQQRLWFMDQLDPGNPAYNVSQAIRLTGRLDVGALRGAWQEIVRRHDLLRAFVPAPDDEPSQHVTACARIEIPLIDLTALPPEMRQVAEARRIGSESLAPFTLSVGPLWRVRLLQVAPDEYVMTTVLHHIICDAWSVAALIGEFSALYRALAGGRPSPLAALPLQYADYAVWQRQWLTGDVLEQQLAYWASQLAGLAPLPLRPDFVGSVSGTRGSGHVRLTADLEFRRSVEALARAEGVTVFMVTLAAFQLLLARWSGVTDVAVLADVANRTRAEVEPLVGFFVNQLVLRTDLSGAPTFRQLLARVRAVTLGAYAHQAVPFEQVVDAVAGERGLGDAPLSRVKIVFQNSPKAVLDLPELCVSMLEHHAGDAKLDLLLMLEPDADGIRGVLEYDASLFAAETAQLFVTQFDQLLRNAVAAPDESIMSIPLVSASELERLRAVFTETGR